MKIKHTSLFRFIFQIVLLSYACTFPGWRFLKSRLLCSWALNLIELSPLFNRLSYHSTIWRCPSIVAKSSGVMPLCNLKKSRSLPNKSRGYLAKIYSMISAFPPAATSWRKIFCIVIIMDKPRLMKLLMVVSRYTKIHVSSQGCPIVNFHRVGIKSPKKNSVCQVLWSPRGESKEFLENIDASTFGRKQDDPVLSFPFRQVLVLLLVWTSVWRTEDSGHQPP